MVEIEVDVPREGDLAGVEQVIEECCVAEGLLVGLKGTLASYPGCVHWHFKREAQRGTLEVTWWAQAQRVWFSVQAGRTGAWIEEAIVRLKETLEMKFAEYAG